MRTHAAVHIFVLLIFTFLSQSQLRAQAGLPALSTTEPVELGFINLNNGNLHIEIPLASLPQRGNLPRDAKLVYDSKIWYVFNNGTTNVWQPQENGGWKVVLPGDPGKMQHDITYTSCSPQPGNYAKHDNWTWIAADGSQKKFNLYWPTWTRTADPYCYELGTATLNNAAGDGTGYVLKVTNYTDAVVTSFDGTQVWPVVKDTNGNFITNDVASGTFTDSLGRSIQRQTLDDYTDRYSFPGLGASTRPFDLQWTDKQVSTTFQQSGVSPYQTTIRTLSQINLPDGTSYSFTYDDFGQLSTLTLPTGGQITYSYALVQESTTTQNRWATNRTSAGGAWSYVPQVGTCDSARCDFQTKVTRPTQEYSNYTFGRLWDGVVETKAEHFDNLGNLFATVEKTYSSQCCVGASLISSVLETLPVQGGPSIKRKTEYDRQTSDLARNVREWDFTSAASFNALPDRETNNVYTSLGPYSNDSFGAYRLTSSKVKLLSGGVQYVISQTSFSYDEFPVQSTANDNVSHHDSAYGYSSQVLRGNLTSISHWLNTSSTWVKMTNTYDDLGNLRTTTDPGGHTTQFVYSSTYQDAYPTQITNALNQTVTNAYNFNTGQVTSTTDANLQPTTYEYDENLRPKTVFYPDGGASGIDYLSPTSVAAKEKIDAANWSYAYGSIDSYGRLTQAHVSDPLGDIYVDTYYDTSGRAYKKSNPYRSQNEPTYGTIETQFDALGRVKNAVLQNGDTVQTQYSGNAMTTIDPSGKQKKIIRDGLGRIASVWEPDTSGTLSYETNYQYSVDASTTNTIVRIDQKGGASNQTEWRTRIQTFDSLGRVISATAPETGTVTYSYDADGNLRNKADARAVATSGGRPSRSSRDGVNIGPGINYSYDALHRVTEEFYSDGTPSVSYFYDLSNVGGVTLENPIGRLSFTSVNQAVDSVTVTRSTRPLRLNPSSPPSSTPTVFPALGTVFSYDVMGRVKKSWQCIPGLPDCKVFINSYNVDGSLDSITYPSGRVVKYGYDSIGRQNSVKLASMNGNVLNTSYLTVSDFDSTGGAKTHVLGNGVSTTISMNQRLQASEVTTTKAGQTLLHRLYSYVDANAKNNGNVISVTDQLNSSLTQTYDYDPLNRLKTASTTAWNISYEYDPWGNLLHKTVNSGPATGLNAAVDSHNRLVLTGVGYDAVGNMLNDGIHTYKYDAENRLTDVDSGTATYSYEGAQRVKTRVGAVSTYYFYVNGAPVAELKGANWTDYIISGEGLIAREDVAAGATHYFVGDHLGSTSLVTNASGVVEQRSEFYPFGEEQVVTGNLADHRYRFTSYERDVESNLDYAVFRHHNARFGRFMQPDPLSGEMDNPQSFNRYSYGLNNPMNVVDPLGLDGCTYSSGAANCGVTYNGGGTGTGGLWFGGPFNSGSSFGTAGFFSSTPLFGAPIYGAYVGTTSPIPAAVHPNTPASVGSGNIGAAGTWEGLIPIWGSGRNAIYNYQVGNYWTAAGYTALAVSDVFLVKSIATGLARGGWKLAPNAWKATRVWMLENGQATAFKDLHHWLIPQRGWAKAVPNWLKNQPWNLMSVESAAEHAAIEGRYYLGNAPYGPVGRLWYGTPRWFKAITFSYWGRSVAYGVSGAW